MGLESSINLLVTAMDLKLVQSVVRAMRAVDGPCRPGSLIRPAARIEPRKVIEPTPRFESRVVYTPTPRIEGRWVHHPEPRIDNPAAPPSSPEAPRPIQWPIQPPWKVLPWDNMPQPAPLKVIHKPPDVSTKGRLFDVFI